MGEFWSTLPGNLRDLVLLVLLLAPLGLSLALIPRGYSLWPLLRGLFRRHWGLSLVFTGLIAVAVAMSVGLTAQERGLREGMARSADKFDLIIAPPGNEITTMLATVYLHPSQMQLLGADIYDRVAQHPLVASATPLAFGDSYEGAPVVGTTPGFVTHLSDGLAAGRVFKTEDEAVIGTGVALALGEEFEPVHGTGNHDELDEHGAELTVTGIMPPTGSPWDNAILVPVEQVWEVHALPNGHPLDWGGTVGPPFDPASFPGTPAILVTTESLWEAYSLRNEFSTTETMAFFPGTVLAELHAIMGDIRSVISTLTIVTQALVAVSVLAGLTILMRLLARRVALLRALGAPKRFAFALSWSFATLMICAGAALGLLLGAAGTAVVSDTISAQTQIIVTARLGWDEFQLAAGFTSAASLLSLLPAWIATTRPLVEDLRA
ncbi:MAG: ABC transporter permease [Rhodobacteraceae bacterium]|nr:ABC transporter permease [Paracoccaceae bacterium]